jgi:hypothetical protein
MEKGNAQLATIHKHVAIDAIFITSPTAKHGVRVCLWGEGDVGTSLFQLRAGLWIAFEVARFRVHLAITGLTRQARIGGHFPMSCAIDLEKESQVVGQRRRAGGAGSVHLLTNTEGLHYLSRGQITPIARL